MGGAIAKSFLGAMQELCSRGPRAPTSSAAKPCHGEQPFRSCLRFTNNLPLHISLLENHLAQPIASSPNPPSPHSTPQTRHMASNYSRMRAWPFCARSPAAFAYAAGARRGILPRVHASTIPFWPSRSTSVSLVTMKRISPRYHGLSRIT